MSRIIGIKHRTKRTAEGEARPTMVHVIDGDQAYDLTLETDTDELDFVLGRFPTGYRAVNPDENLSLFPKHHIKTKEVDGVEVPQRVPTGYTGLRSGDTVAMLLGGSGDRLAYALARQGNFIGAQVLRLPTFVFKRHRPDEDKERDHDRLAELAQAQPGLFRPTTPKDMELIIISERYRWRQEAQKARKACEQRLRQRAIGSVFLSEDGRYPEGSIEDYFDGLKASDAILGSLVAEEKRREDELRKAVRKLDVWADVFEPIEGCGEVIAAGIIAGIQDIRRFETAPKLKAFCGVHVLPDGRIPRKRLGLVANWHPEVRQSLYQLGDQFNRRPKSTWGLKLREYKVKLRAAHPEVVITDNGKKRYTDGHIHKMALWRTITKFVEWLHKEWTRVETRESVAA